MYYITVSLLYACMEGAFGWDLKSNITHIGGYGWDGRYGYVCLLDALPIYCCGGRSVQALFCVLFVLVPIFDHG
jgi:hypothetical protein